MPSAALRRAGLGLLVLALAGCDLWLGDKKAPPLPGKRVSVLLHDPKLKVDVEAGAQPITLPPPSVNAEWPQAGGYANNAMHHVEVGASLKRAWDVDVGDGASDYEKLVAPPVVAAGRVFVMDASTVVSAYDAETGRRLWRTGLTPKDDDDGHIGGGLAYADGRIFATTGFAQVVALDAATGAPAWKQSIGGPMRAPPTVRSGRVFAITVDNKLYALDAASGATLWTHTGASESASLLGGANPAVEADVVVAPFSSGELVAFRADTGRVLWSESLASGRRTDSLSTLAHIRGRPVIDRGRVFAMSHGELMVALDLRSGQRLWDKEIGGLDTLWVAGAYLFALTSNAELAALTRDAGRTLWVAQLPRYVDEEKKKNPIVWTGPILVSDRLIVAGSNGEAFTISPYDGRFLGRIKLPSGVAVPPVAANRSIYFLSDNARLVAYR